MIDNKSPTLLINICFNIDENIGTNIDSDIDAYIALWGSQQAVTKQQFLDNLSFTCNACNTGFR